MHCIGPHWSFDIPWHNLLNDLHRTLDDPSLNKESSSRVLYFVMVLLVTGCTTPLATCSTPRGDVSVSTVVLSFSRKIFPVNWVNVQRGMPKRWDHGPSAVNSIITSPQCVFRHRCGYVLCLFVFLGTYGYGSWFAYWTCEIVSEPWIWTCRTCGFLVCTRRCGRCWRLSIQLTVYAYQRDHPLSGWRFDAVAFAAYAMIIDCSCLCSGGGGDSGPCASYHDCRSTVSLPVGLALMIPLSISWVCLGLLLPRKGFSVVLLGIGMFMCVVYWRTRGAVHRVLGKVWLVEDNTPSSTLVCSVVNIFGGSCLVTLGSPLKRVAYDSLIVFIHDVLPLLTRAIIVSFSIRFAAASNILLASKMASIRQCVEHNW